MRKWLPLLVLNFCILAAVSWLAAGATPVQQSTTPTPPPPTWTPGPPPPKTPVPPINLPGPDGGQIELRVQFAPAWWQRRTVHWQELWTVIQWQDRLRNWHDVEGWRGGLDEIVNGEGGKTWWVARTDLGKGPFRWLVYDRAGGKLLAASQSFNLPSVSGQTVKVQVELEP